jgi:hypothetical protein
LIEDVLYFNTHDWTCPTCLLEVFPFTVIEDPHDLQQILSPTTTIDYSQLQELLLNPLDSEDGDGVLADIDPDENYYNSPSMQTPKTQYLLVDALNTKIDASRDYSYFSTFHTNIRSTPKNYDNFNHLLSLITHKFTILAITETWLKPHNIDLFPINGYQHEHSIRTSKTGGGISLYIQEHIDYKVHTDLNHTDNELEMLWVEMDKNTTGTSKNIIYGCTYRNPELLQNLMTL